MRKKVLPNLPFKADDGIILHAFNWPFRSIASRLFEIAEAGYKSVQVSPVQGTKSKSTDINDWWLLYQPTNQRIGNAQLGNEKDFKKLCNDAKKYNISIIVDAVLNHMANNGDYNKLDNTVSSIFKDPYFYHNQGQCCDFNNRWAVTQQGIGMPDLDTSNKEVQNLAIDFLNSCIDDGAAGFRFDGAKHIETNVGLDYKKPWASDYWYNVLGNLKNKENLLVYGEVLQGGADNINAYEQFMKVTAHSYSWDLRSAIITKNLRKTFGMCGLNPYHCISYVENHDNYMHKESILTSFEVKIAWSILAARAGVIPLFFARPSINIGDDQWKSPEIIAINKFHNAMIGNGEYLRWARDETMLIERGNLGIVVINLGNNTSINCPTALKNGCYCDKLNIDHCFNVYNGIITGNIAQNEVAILY